MSRQEEDGDGSGYSRQMERQRDRSLSNDQMTNNEHRSSNSSNLNDVTSNLNNASRVHQQVQPHGMRPMGFGQFSDFGAHMTPYAQATAGHHQAMPLSFGTNGTAFSQFQHPNILPISQQALIMSLQQQSGLAGLGNSQTTNTSTSHPLQQPPLSIPGLATQASITFPGAATHNPLYTNTLLQQPPIANSHEYNLALRCFPLNNPMYRPLLYLLNIHHL